MKINVSESDFDSFKEACINAPKPNKNLIKAKTLADKLSEIASQIDGKARIERIQKRSKELTDEQNQRPQQAR